jgi:hypothetical protein
MQQITEFYVDVKGWSLSNIYKMAVATGTKLDVDRQMLICAEVYKK